MRLELVGHHIEALSVGGVETCFQIPAFDCCLDIGRCPPGAVARSRLFLTHAHMDHAAGLPYYVSMRAMQHLPPPTIYCPSSAEPKLQTILDTWTDLDSDANRCALVGLRPGAKIPMGGNREAVSFHSFHRVETLGYCLFTLRRKLRPELHGLDGPAIAKRAQSGETIHLTESVPEICFPGDTGIQTIEEEPMVRKARLLLLECTFIGDKPGRKWARAGGHIHLDDILERSDLFENEAILLTHFSRRYPFEDIKKEIDARVPPHLRERMHLLPPAA